ncbi:catalytic domain of components of various dehydrogenase complexes [Haloterrigena turkmenica DSM 5511]|uniref:Catalytic domain of components of various dehydrogenase complexes n=1 Tax=Haloterrigena turkmenica (strain ATCC 51198 / DSM 5511 / JCM 9101 / NCIMB 13204 / VKM B-1734 / 4k) TaxID=543526 RepID=D2RR61_HALTV|nr:2-oxo acid dehydrogenase subunit E2 [Haloterrigena turkmenica]ADB62457.1 catalytic domain of components of various dehydrogenase complexes [Haloterrigena turkmenica DSM 5511]
MLREFELPDVGEGVAEGELVSWLVEEGETVSEDQPVAEVETDKALVEVPAPVNGTVRELHVEEGEVVPVGTVIISFNVEGEESETTTDEEQGRAGEPEGVDAPEEATTAGSETGAETDEAAGSPEAIGADAEETATPQDRVFAPPRVRRMAREEGIDLSSLEGSGPGGRITAADVQAAASGGPVGGAQAQQPAETAAESGATTGDSSETGGAAVETEGRTEAESGIESEAGSGAASAGEPTTPPANLESADRDKTLAAPATRRIAREKGIDIDAVPTDEEREGEAFVTPEAVREYAEAQQRAQEADREAVEAGEPVGAKGTDFAEGERERREPFRGVRKRIAEAMVESKYSAPHVTHHDEVDVTELVEAREELKPRAEERGIRLTYMPFIMKAVVAALQEFPEMNAVIDEEGDEIVYRDYYNVGVATATDVGLMVPVVENADEKGLLQLSSEMNELVQKARERSISPGELRGSTFTITNVGAIGGEYATPIINYPEAGILAIGAIKRKPRVMTDENGNESIEPRSVLTLSLSFDHRLIDGAIAAQFTNTVMEYLENPSLLLLE